MLTAAGSSLFPQILQWGIESGYVSEVDSGSGYSRLRGSSARTSYEISNLSNYRLPAYLRLFGSKLNKEVRPVDLADDQVMPMDCRRFLTFLERAIRERELVISSNFTLTVGLPVKSGYYKLMSFSYNDVSRPSVTSTRSPATAAAAAPSFTYSYTARPSTAKRPTGVSAAEIRPTRRYSSQYATTTTSSSSGKPTTTETFISVPVTATGVTTPYAVRMTIPSRVGVTRRASAGVQPMLPPSGRTVGLASEAMTRSQLAAPRTVSQARLRSLSTEPGYNTQQGYNALAVRTSSTYSGRLDSARDLVAAPVSPSRMTTAGRTRPSATASAAAAASAVYTRPSAASTSAEAESAEEAGSEASSGASSEAEEDNVITVEESDYSDGDYSDDNEDYSDASEDEFIFNFLAGVGSEGISSEEAAIVPAIPLTRRNRSQSGGQSTAEQASSSVARRSPSPVSPTSRQASAVVSRTRSATSTDQAEDEEQAIDVTPVRDNITASGVLSAGEAGGQ